MTTTWSASSTRWARVELRYLTTLAMTDRRGGQGPSDTAKRRTLGQPAAPSVDATGLAPRGRSTDAPDVDGLTSLVSTGRSWT